MMKRLFIFISVTFLFAGAVAQSNPASQPGDTLVVLWTSGDRDVAEKSCLMYTHASKKYGWFDEVILVIWGPSARLTVEDKEIREKVLKMQEDGVILEACVACANMLGVTEELKELGVDVKGMGVPLTSYLKSDYKVLTY